MPRAFTHCSTVTFADGKWEAWHFNGARSEAKCLIRLLDKNGNTLDSIRELIRVAPEEVTGGEVLIEIADAVGTKLVRHQIRVSVESLVRGCYPSGILDSVILSETGSLDQQESSAALPDFSRPQAEAANRNAGSERTSIP